MQNHWKSCKTDYNTAQQSEKIRIAAKNKNANKTSLDSHPSEAGDCRGVYTATQNEQKSNDII